MPPPERHPHPATTESADGSLEEAFVQARQKDPPGLAFAQTQIAGALFGSVDAGRVGRFRVLERLGAGGMGVVYAAYDPDLDRGVALKLVHVPGRGRDAALAEAKALARLSHPNVVPVYDVGIEGEHVYIVMELVRGETLAAWVTGRERRPILDAYRQAGEALAAAHAAGLVHRDFKPANAIVATDGRVRVVDFGLACEAAEPEQAGRQQVAGTPRYMAPEQAAGAPVGPAADQYSFAVALAEALAGPLPRWLEAVIERGRAREPAGRFPSMRELLRALARDPARLWRRRVVAGLAAAVCAAAFFAGRATPSSVEEGCGDGEARLMGGWPSGVRAEALARIAKLGAYGQTLAPRLEEQLRAHTQRWAAGYGDACRARRAGIQSAALVDRRMACLDRSRAAMKSVAEIVGGADARALPEVALAVRALPDPDACTDLQALLADVEPPPPAVAERVAGVRARTEQARIEVAAGRFDRARGEAEDALAEARAIGYRPAVAEILTVGGHALMGMNRRADAVPLLREAATLGFAAGANGLGVEAWARRAWAQGTKGDATALAGLDVVEALALRNSSARFERALLFHNVGGVELALGSRDRARAAFERALEHARGVVGPGAVELVNVRVSLALAVDDPERRERLLADAEAELTRLLGGDHPETLRTRRIRGMMTVPLAPSMEVLTGACAGLELHAGFADRVVTCWSEVAFIARELAETDRAIAALERASRAGPDPAVVAYLTLWKGNARGAADQFAAALRGLPSERDQPWWVRLQRAELELGLGRSQLAAAAPRAARPALAASVAGLSAIARDHPSAALDRRLARARADLAGALVATGGSGAEITKLAGVAVLWLRQAAAPASEIQRLERLSDARPH